jgi:hypothetical protein
MTVLQKIKDFFAGTPAPEQIDGQFVDQPKDYPECLPKDELEETVVQPGDSI